MRSIIVVSLLFLLALSVACGSRNSDAPSSETMFRVKTKQIAKADDLVIVKVDFSFYGKRKISFGEGEGSMSSASGGNSEEITKGSLLLVVDLLGAEDASRVKFLGQIRVPGVICGGPEVGPVEAGMKVKNLFNVTVKNGEYPIGSEIDVAVFRGRTFRMKVE